MNWINVKDRLPENDQTVLGINENVRMLPHKANFEDQVFHSLEMNATCPCHFTHWMPIPPFPGNE